MNHCSILVCLRRQVREEACVRRPSLLLTDSHTRHAQYVNRRKVGTTAGGTALRDMRRDNTKLVCDYLLFELAGKVLLHDLDFYGVENRAPSSRITQLLHGSRGCWSPSYYQSLLEPLLERDIVRLIDGPWRGITIEGAMKHQRGHPNLNDETYQDYVMIMAAALLGLQRLSPVEFLQFRRHIVPHLPCARDMLAQYQSCRIDIRISLLGFAQHICLEESRLSEANTYARELYSITKRSFPQHQALTLSSLSNLAIIHYHWGKLNKAEKLELNVLNTLRKSARDNGEMVWRSQINLLRIRGKMVRAVDPDNECQRITFQLRECEQELGCDHTLVSELKGVVACVTKPTRSTIPSGFQEQRFSSSRLLIYWNDRMMIAIATC